MRGVTVSVAFYSERRRHAMGHWNPSKGRRGRLRLPPRGFRITGVSWVDSSMVAVGGWFIRFGMPLGGSPRRWIRGPV